MSRIALIQLARAGDIVSMLPAAKHLADVGNEVTIFTHPDFAGILEAVSYVKIHLHETTHRDVSGAALAAEQIGFDRVIKCQVDGNPDRPPANTENFITQQWARLGMLDKFHDLPLVFDRRDVAGEAEAIRNHVPPEDGRPLLAFNFNGHSSKYLPAKMQSDWVREAFSKTHRLMDLSGICLKKVHHLLGLIEQADCLLTIDTLHLHLGYATGTPTIAMSAGQTPRGEPSLYYNSEPRANWVYRCHYEESMRRDVRAEMQRIIQEPDFAPGRLVRDVRAMQKARVHHVFHWFLGSADEKRRAMNAFATWDRQHCCDALYSMVYHELATGDRTSADVGDSKAVPFIRDVIDRGCRDAQDDDLVIFTNTDICLTPETIDLVREKLKDQPVAYSRRCDVSNGSVKLKLSDLKDMRVHVGADLFAFKASWWREHRESVPDLLISYEGWDFVFRRIAEQHTAKPELTPCIYHESHASHWAKPMIVKTSPAQLYNRKVCREWCIAHGMETAMYGENENTNFLFRSDDEWKNHEARLKHLQRRRAEMKAEQLA